MVTMMTTTTNNNNHSVQADLQPYFYKCCSIHSPTPYLNLDAEPGKDDDRINTASGFFKPSTSNEAGNSNGNDQTFESAVNNNNIRWPSVMDVGERRGDSILNDSIEKSIENRPKLLYDDGRNNNGNYGTSDDGNSRVDLLTENSYCRSTTEHDVALTTLDNVEEEDSPVTDAAKRTNAIDSEYEKFHTTCARAKSRGSVGVLASTAKQRAKSADIYSLTSCMDNSVSSYYYCKCPSNCGTSDAGVRDSLNSVNGDAGMVRSAEATPSSAKTTLFRPVPTCKALRMAVLALYRLDDFERVKIGQGFFSEVFEVHHKVTGENMALKLNTMSSNRPNVLREVQTMRRLKHPNVLRFKGVCVDKGQLHALTEFCNGGSLEQLIKSGSNTNASTGSNVSLAPFPWLLRAKLAADIASGMQYVHSCGYIHRDLTSKNVLLKRDDYGGVPYRYTAVIADFGLSCKIPKPGSKVAAVGTPYWMAPECLNDEMYTEIADVFSYGIILCEMIARIDADPDYMPRTATFGLDYVRFSELCPLDTPVDFLKLAFRCCLMDPNSRPNLDQIVHLARSLVKSLQDPPPSEFLPRQISHILAANGVSPTHYAAVGCAMNHINGGENAGSGQRFSVMGVTRTPLLSTPLKLVRCHSDIGITGSEEAGETNSNAAANSESISKIVDDERLSQSPSSALNRALAHRIAADDPFYKPADDGESVNPFAGDQRFAGGRKIVTDSCYASPSVLGNLDGPSPVLSSLNTTPILASNDAGSFVLGPTACQRRFTIWKQCHGVLTLTREGATVQTTPPMRRARSLPCSPILSSSSQSNGYLYVDVKEGGDCCAADSSDEQQQATQKQQASPNHVQVRRVTQVFEEQDKLFVDNRQKQKKSMKKALTLSTVDGSGGGTSPLDADASALFTFCSPVPVGSVVMEVMSQECGKKVDVLCVPSSPIDDKLESQQPVVVRLADEKRMAGAAARSTSTELKSPKRIERVKSSGSKRQRKRKDRSGERGDSAGDDEPNAESSCAGSLQSNCSLF